MKRTTIALLLAAACMLFSGIAAFGSSDIATKPSTPVLTDDSDPVELVIHGVNDEFDPQVLTVFSGTVYHLTLINDDNDEHDWEVDDVGLTQSCVGPGCQRDVTFTAPAPGTYKFYCIVHAEMGGTLFVK